MGIKEDLQIAFVNKDASAIARLLIELNTLLNLPPEPESQFPERVRGIQHILDSEDSVITTVYLSQGIDRLAFNTSTQTVYLSNISSPKTKKIWNEIK